MHGVAIATLPFPVVVPKLGIVVLGLDLLDLSSVPGCLFLYLLLPVLLLLLQLLLRVLLVLLQLLKPVALLLLELLLGVLLQQHGGLLHLLQLGLALQQLLLQLLHVRLSCLGLVLGHHGKFGLPPGLGGVVDVAAARGFRLRRHAG